MVDSSYKQQNNYELAFSINVKITFKIVIANLFMYNTAPLLKDGSS